MGEKACRKIARENTESCIKFEFPKNKNKFSHKYRPCNSQATLILKGFRVAQLVKKPPAMQEIPILFLGWEYPLEKQ